jgi:uncharacterized Tic20 family protein
MMSVQVELTHDERNMAATAQSLGVLAALPIWLAWRNRSAFVRAHAIQSIVFDGLTMAALIVVAVLAIGLALGGNVLLASQPGNADLLRLFLVALCAPGLALIGLLVVLVAALVLRIRAAMAANKGRPFQYPLLRQIRSM